MRSSIPEVGKHIQWIDVLETVFRVIDFDRNGTTVNLNKGAAGVMAKSETEPYGYLLVESPALPREVGLPIIHNNDFYLASTIFNDPEFAPLVGSPDTELLVTYAPKNHMDGYSASPEHVLHYAITPRGTLEKYHSKSVAKPDLIFGPYKYEGLIRVNMNLQPNI
jgi:hypothetical protein